LIAVEPSRTGQNSNFQILNSKKITKSAVNKFIEIKKYLDWCKKPGNDFVPNNLAAYLRFIGMIDFDVFHNFSTLYWIELVDKVEKGEKI